MYNKEFHLTPKELTLVETALRDFTHHNPEEARRVRQLLAKFYHQKNWYHPKDKIYISG
jgi:hypothetical protein